MGKVVTFDPEKIDRHGRTVAVVRLQDGTDVCLGQIQVGLAWHFKRYEKEQTAEDRAAYSAAELTARAARRGLWRDESPVPPWGFERNCQRPKGFKAACISGNTAAYEQLWDSPCWSKKDQRGTQPTAGMKKALRLTRRLRTVAFTSAAAKRDADGN